MIVSEVDAERGIRCTCGAPIPEEYLAGKLLFAHGLDEIRRKIYEIHERLKPQAR